MKFTSNEYFACTGWIEYAGASFSGTVDGNGVISRTSDPVPTDPAAQRFTFVDLVADAPLKAMVITPPGVVPPANWAGTTDNLLLRSDTADGKTGFIGESGALVGASAWDQTGARMNGQEAYLPLDPTACMTPQDFNITTVQYTAAGLMLPAVTWVGRLQNMGPVKPAWFPQYNDMLLTTYIERPNNSGTTSTPACVAYNYYFAADVGLVEETWLVLNSDGVTGSGYRRMMTGYSLT